MQSNASEHSEADVFLSARDVKRRYGNVSDMWLYRREHEENSDFPKPLRICGRRYWRASDLLSWEAPELRNRRPLMQWPSDSRKARAGAREPAGETMNLGDFPNRGTALYAAHIMAQACGWRAVA
jgi:predicted DNA-binding transcriptional regulator AlpA